MKLDAHLKKNSLNQNSFAEKLAKKTRKSVAACATVINKIINHGHVPRPEYIAAIVEISNGDVTPNDLYGVDG